MTIQCTHCGTPLIGEVNRCWKCGNALAPSMLVDAEAPVTEAIEVEGGQVNVADPSCVEVPPVRDAAPPEGGSAKDETPEDGVVGGGDDASKPHGEGDAHANETAVSTAAETSSPEPTLESLDSEPSPAERQQVGSPFATASLGQIQTSTVATQYPKHIANSVGATLSILLGAMALVEAPYVPVGAVLTALIGLACGVWGIKSNRRKSSTFGMLLCCIALTWGIFNTAVEMYTHFNGTDPFAPNTIIEPGEDDEFPDAFDESIDPNF